MKYVASSEDRAVRQNGDSKAQGGSLMQFLLSFRCDFLCSFMTHENALVFRAGQSKPFVGTGKFCTAAKRGHLGDFLRLPWTLQEKNRIAHDSINTA